MANETKQVELLFVWSYKTQHFSTSPEHTSARVVFSREENIFFFSDHTYVRTDISTPYETVLKIKAIDRKKWMVAENNLILLDVDPHPVRSMEQPVQNGHSVNDHLEVIFVNSYDKYPLHAMHHAADCQNLRAIHPDELNEALNKMENSLRISESLNQSDELKKYVDQVKLKNDQENKIMISTNEGAVFVKIGDIIHLESSSNYTILHLERHKKMIASKTLSVFEEILEPMNFMRIHRSNMINLNKLRSIEYQQGNYFARMNDRSELEIARRKKKELFERIAYSV